ncbi:ABC transporter [Pontibacillus halophilus JSM 076056 = DSM 19796]|uniref:ABC transporter n=1 Tax=Pontibacillus halophilus JSM 076056 = DSM 19796 TaxID=1385510 RepID=A0A0A5GMJ4_9BACI|nr:ABC transporter ATP-binding protein [Pontibacillus halophilus]KGX92385.1 ABC transporter [Pontibacillus halophilus JSM 076056 = DSM 19796]
MIESKNLSKTFQRDKVVQDVTFHVKKGSIYGLLGSNGAGKTTLMRILAGILRQDEGEVLIGDEPVYENVKMKGKMVFIPDSLYFFNQYTTDQLAKFYQDLYPNWNQQRYEKLAEMLKLDTNKKVSRFSKGMQRQVGFWLALSAMPDILILDEPFDGLDPVTRRTIKNLVVQDVADREMTVLISSHNLREVEDICDHVGILHKGSMLLQRDLDELKSDIHKVQVAFKGGMPEGLKDNLDVLHEETRGSVKLLIIRGEEEDVSTAIESYQPVLYDLLPLTLEEIFIYEMGGVGYAIDNILV